MDINNQGDGQTPVEPSQEPQTPEVQPQVDEAQGDEKKGASQRIRELSQQAKAAEEKTRSLEERIAQLTKPVDEPAYIPQVKPGEEITPERYQQDIEARARSLVKLEYKQLEAETRIKAETAEVTQTYPQLNPKAKEFDHELSDTITEAVEAHIRVSPYSASVKKFVDRLMKPYTKAVEKEVGQVTEKLAKQVTETALRPTSVRKGEKAATDMTLAELEAKLGVVNS